jgi:hypothetical protein
MNIEDINPHIKTLGGGHQIIDFQSLRCGMDTTANVSDPNAIRLARHLIIRRKRFAMDMQQDDERMWAAYFLYKTLSTGIEGTQTISVATVSRAIQIVGTEKEARKKLLNPSPSPRRHAHEQLTTHKNYPPNAKSK